MELHRMDSIVAFFSGMFGGFIKYMAGVLLLDVGFISRLFEAGATALVCGFLGIAGKRLYEFVQKKFFSKKTKQ